MSTGFTNFIKKRFERKAFVGLPLTLLVTVFVLLVASFLGITNSIVNSSTIVKIDATFSQLLFTQRTVFLAKMFYFITHFASQQTIVVLMFITLAYFYWKKELLYFWAIIITFLGTEGTVYLTKILINRDRPGNDIAFYIEKTKSFPSGHSAISMAFYGFLIYYFVRTLKNETLKDLIIFLGFLLIFLVGFSRIYLGVHYLSDVLGGFIMGAVWLVLGIISRERSFYLSSLKSTVEDLKNKIKESNY